MLPDGIGLMGFNGDSGLVYYASEARRVLVSNRGLVVSLLVSKGSFRRLTAAVLGGVIGARSLTWLTRKIDERHQVHLADALDWLLSQLPTSVGWGYSRLSRAISMPQRVITTTASNFPPQFH